MKAGDSDKDFKPYWNEWNELFQCKSYKSKLHKLGIKGLLQGSRFRSICWKIYLECLPEDPSLWIEKTKSQRQRYEEILDKFKTNPRCDIENEDIDINNPLTQSQSSPWYQYFQDKRLKHTIKQDVVRTFPEIQFFQSKDIRKMMIKILFLYAREFPYISYKQGMHELLAPIIYVLHHDQQATNIAFLEASESDDLELTARILLNQNYIEHDAFLLFCKLMEAVEEWYISSECLMDRKHIDQDLFVEDSPNESNTTMGIKLKQIHNNLLKQHDPDLFSYLEQMEITPQIYGIRWLRLLFGREFVLHDLLIIWDVIFSDSATLDLVNYIFIAMLICIRESLMQDDYACSLSYLMRYPRNTEVRYIINLALYLRDPDKCAKPAKYCDPTSKSSSKSSKDNKKGFKTLSKSIFPGYAKPVKELPVNQTESRPQTLKISRASSLPSSEPIVSYPQSSPESEYHLRSTSVHSKSPIYNFESENKLNDSGMDDVESSQSSYFVQNSYTLPRTTIRNVMAKDHKFKAADFSQNVEHLMNAKSSAAKGSFREMVPLTPRISDHLLPLDHQKKIEDNFELQSLKSELSKLMVMNQYCVHQLSLHVERLQDKMVSQKLVFEDEMFIALAGIKRARDILKGSVSFSQDVIGDDINPYVHVSNNSANLLKECLTSNEAQFGASKNFVVDSNMCDNSASTSKVNKSDES